MRRHLEKTEKSLHNSSLIFSLALRRDFARKPAYWVEIYAVPKGRYRFYSVAKQWSFFRKETKEDIQNQRVFSPCNSLVKALENAFDVIQSKVENGWLVCEGQYSDPVVVTPNTEELVKIKDTISNWDFDTHKPISSTQTKKENLPRSEKFKKAQARRRAKAEW
jgi:hypothetical protein